MSNYTIDDAELENVRGKVILVTGGANGIGHAIVGLALGMNELCHRDI